MTFDPSVFKIDDSKFASQIGSDSETGQSTQDGQHYDFITLHDVLNQPIQVYLIKNLIPENATGFILGSWGTLKSFLGVDFAMTLTTGKGDFHGHEAQTGAVCYIAGEGAGGIGKRTRAWMIHHDKPDTKAPFYLLRKNFRILDIGDVEKLIATIKHFEAQYGIQFKLVIIDTLSRAIAGQKEDETNFSLALAHGDQIKEELGNGASVAIVHHKGKDGSKGGRGSSVAESNADFILDLVRPEKDQLQVKVKKLKDDEDGQTYNFTTRLITWEREGVGEQSSLVLEKTPSAWEMRGTKDLIDLRSDIACLPNGMYSLNQLAARLQITPGSRTKFNAKVRRAIPTEAVSTANSETGEIKMVWRTDSADQSQIYVAMGR